MSISLLILQVAECLPYAVSIPRYLNISKKRNTTVYCEINLLRTTKAGSQELLVVVVGVVVLVVLVVYVPGFMVKIRFINGKSSALFLFIRTLVQCDPQQSTLSEC